MAWVAVSGCRGSDQGFLGVQHSVFCSLHTALGLGCRLQSSLEFKASRSRDSGFKNLGVVQLPE